MCNMTIQSSLDCRKGWSVGHFYAVSENCVDHCNHTIRFFTSHVFDWIMSDMRQFDCDPSCIIMWHPCRN